MGLKDFFKKSNDNNNTETEKSPFKLNAPAVGHFVQMKDIPDPVFAEGVLGTCSAVDPESDIVFAPSSGKIIQLAETGHAVGIECDNGVQILLHIGIDTVKMNGDGFKAFVKEGQKVSKGEKLVKIDVDKIKAAGYSPAVICIITNSAEFSKIEPFKGDVITTEDVIFTVAK